MIPWHLSGNGKLKVGLIDLEQEKSWAQFETGGQYYVNAFSWKIENSVFALGNSQYEKITEEESDAEKRKQSGCWFQVYKEPFGSGNPKRRRQEKKTLCGLFTFSPTRELAALLRMTNERVLFG